MHVFNETNRHWSGRRRDPKVNGSDLYVARITKHGVGNARPCWRCIEWCKWAGVKRIFHFVGDAGQFHVVKVNEARGDATYETHADVRLFAGAVSGNLYVHSPRLMIHSSHGETLYSILLFVLWFCVIHSCYPLNDTKFGFVRVYLSQSLFYYTSCASVS